MRVHSTARLRSKQAKTTGQKDISNWREELRIENYLIINHHVRARVGNQEMHDEIDDEAKEEKKLTKNGEAL